MTSLSFPLKSKMNRETFFKDAQKCLLKAKSWKEFVQVAQEIKTDQAQFTLPVSLYSDYQNVVKDDISIQLMPSDSHPELIPMKSYGDGNCLFRSLSLIIFGHERNHTEVRVRIIIELACNEELYLSEKTFEDMAEYSYDGIMDYIIQVSVSDRSYVPNNKERSFQNEVMHSTKSDTYASVLHIIASCNIIKKPINSIYPMVNNPGVDRDAHNQVFFPIGNIYYPEKLNEVVTILWTHTSDTNLKGWKPNHFVPCFPESLSR